MTDMPKGWIKGAETIQEADWIVRVHAKPLRHVERCEHPHNDCYCETHWHDGEARVKCEGCDEREAGR